MLVEIAVQLAHRHEAGAAGLQGGLGMSIVAAIVRDLKGVLTVQGDRGAAFTIRAPLPSAQPNLVDRSFQSWAEA